MWIAMVACGAQAPVRPAEPSASTTPASADVADLSVSPVAASATPDAVSASPGQDSAVPGNAAAARPAPCQADAARRTFDFWLGEFTVRDPSGEVVGHNRIEAVEGGCALVERWRGAKGSTGTSVNYLDPVTGEWVQVWIDAGGGLIELRGGPRDGGMHLAGRYVKHTGESSQLRGTWMPLGGGRVRQLFEESTDGGATWTTWFDGVYHPEAAARALR
jgi:hypothetical protein